MEFVGPYLEENSYSSKFIRVGNSVHVTRPGDTFSQHLRLAEEDGILNALNDLQYTNPRMVDGGIIRVDNTNRRIEVYSNSGTLGLPPDKAKEEARRLTGESIKLLTPNYKVETRLGI